MDCRRTDLATEINELRGGEGSGITSSEETVDGFAVTTVTISPEGADGAGKPAGKYITVDTGKIWNAERERFEAAAAVIAGIIKKLAPDAKSFLVAGLGNMGISSDSIGPKAVGKLLVTHHIKVSDPSLFESAGFGDLAATAPGVMAQTGMESSDSVIALTRAGGLTPDCIIAVDSLASRRLARLATTVQLSDTGISPGSGVFNKRTGITPETAGIPVIAIGIPTVVDAATLAADLIEGSGSVYDEALTEKLLSGAGRSMFITPKESDIISDKVSRLIASAVNMAAHPKLTLSEMQEYTS